MESTDKNPILAGNCQECKLFLTTKKVHGWIIAEIKIVVAHMTVSMEYTSTRALNSTQKGSSD